MDKKKKETTALAPFDILTAGLASEATGFNPVPVVIEIIHANQSFEIPGIGNQKRLRGVFLASKKVRVFFANHDVKAVKDELNAFTGGRPFCISSNYKTGEVISKTSEEWKTASDVAIILRDKIGESAGVCAQCPLGGDKAWGSVSFIGKDGNGKCCGEKRRLLYWRLGIRIPIIFTVPSSSVRAVDRYFSSLQAGSLEHFQAITEVTLEEAGTGDIHYSVAKFAMNSDGEEGGLLTDEMIAELVAPVTMQGVELPLFQGLVNIFNARDISEAEVNATAEEATDDF